MRHCAVWSFVVAAGLLVSGTLVGVSINPAFSQDKTKKPAKTTNKPLVKTDGLDTKFSMMQADFIRETEKLANEYYEAGHYDKAKTLLKTILTIEPKHPGVEAKIKYIDEKVLTAHEVDVDLEADGAWHATNISITKGEPIRLSVKGTYRLMLNTMVGPEGFPAKDPKTDMVAEIPMGAVMGIVVTNEKENGQNRRGNPFAIGDGQDFSPKESGLLFVRVNCPPENKNSGKLKISMSGNLRSP